MSKLTRYTQQVFGANAAAAQMAEFGSLANGVPLTYSGATITPAIVQTLSIYLSGWFSAILGSNSPAIEDMNALCYLFAYQLAYIFEMGVPEYDAATTYYTNSLVQSGGIVYQSLTDSNTGNAVSNNSFWGQQQQYGAVVPNTPPGSRTTVVNTCTDWPYLKIATAQTFTVVANSQLIVGGVLNIAGTGVLLVNGICKVY